LRGNCLLKQLLKEKEERKKERTEVTWTQGRRREMILMPQWNERTLDLERVSTTSHCVWTRFGRISKKRARLRASAAAELNYSVFLVVTRRKVVWNPTFRDYSGSLTLEDGTDRQSRHVGFRPPFAA
jgi:hypothetical protein